MQHQRLLTCLGVVLLLGCTETPRPEPAPTSWKLRFAFADDTKQSPLDARAEIWIRGLGSWWLREGETLQIVDGFSPSTEEVLHVYPGGRDTGPDIAVPYMVNEEMNPDGNPRDMIQIGINDELVWVFGTPLEAATGQLEYVFDRSTGEPSNRQYERR